MTFGGQRITPALFTRDEFFAYVNIRPTLGKKILAEHPELTVRIGDRVLIPREAADAFIRSLVAESQR